MSATHDRQDHNLTQTQEFFSQQWRLYQKVLANNYMGHRELYKVLHDRLVTFRQTPFKMLDLGCGDACFIARALEGTAIAAYTGIDLSEVALEIARENLAAIPAEITLIPGDFSECLSKRVTKESERFDLIFTSFALHHLNLAQKEAIVDRIADLLAVDGRFILIDVIRSPGENREPYIDRYLDNVRRDWSLLEAREVTMVEDHMRSSDFPETQETWVKFAGKYGLTQFKCLYQDPLNTTQILCFSQ